MLIACKFKDNTPWRDGRSAQILMWIVLFTNMFARVDVGCIISVRTVYVLPALNAVIGAADEKLK